MPNEYSIAIHNYITKKLDAVQQTIDSDDKCTPYHRGQIEELLWLRTYLKENTDLKDFIYY